MVRDLIISVANRYPAGSLLTMPITGQGFALRPFEGSGDFLKESPNLMILDGQQRLTSLYQAVFRRDGITVKGRTYFFYLDVGVLLSDQGGIDVGLPYFDKALFYVAEEKRGKKVRYEALQPKYELTTREDELSAGALPVGCIFDADGYLADWKKDYLVQRSNNKMEEYLRLDKEWNRLVQPWLDRIRAYPFPVVELRGDMPLGAICHIFEKVNSTGVPLDVFDLCTAILWAQGFHLNDEWTTTRKVLEPLLPMLPKPMSGTLFLQGLSLLASLDRKRTNPGSNIAVTCRRPDLMAMNALVVKKWWNVLVEGYKESAKFMTENGILAERILPYSTLIVSLSAIFGDLKHRKGNVEAGAAWPKIAKWYWCSVFSQRYSGPTETNSAQDVEQVTNWVEGGNPPDAVRTFTFRSDSLQEISSIRNAIYKGVLCLLASKGAKDFGGGGKLSTALFYDTQQDHHHIFPTDALKKLKIEDKRSNSIVNKTLISAPVNRSIGGKLPSQYVGNWRVKLGEKEFDAILVSHGIDQQLLANDHWNDYFLDRREKLRQLIQDICGGTVQPFTDIELEIADVSEEDLE
jgi:hypothetical protein